MSNHDDPAMLSAGRNASLAGLLERIEEQFNAETQGRPDLIADEASRRELIRDVTDYVTTASGIKLSREDRLAVLEMVYRDLFTLSVLDPLVNDPTVTEIKLKGYDQIYVRREAGDLVADSLTFDNPAHLERLIERLLAGVGTTLDQALPFCEIGLRMGDRPARLTLTGAPISVMLHVDLRLHPSQALNLSDLIQTGVLDEAAAETLIGIVRAGHGLMLAGDVGSGKTTLLQALLPLLPTPVVCVERAHEITLPEGVHGLAVTPPTPERPPVEFPDQINTALQRPIRGLAVDEIRSDESAAMWSAITSDLKPQLLFAFRGSTEPLRLRTSFSMAVRKAQQGIEQEYIHSGLIDRLPFVAMLQRVRSPQLGIKVVRIGEWQIDGESLTLREMYPTRQAPPQHPF